jgi:hypothetical protein
VYVADGQRDSVAAAQGRINAQGLPYPIFVEQQSSAPRSYGIRAFPTAYVLDRSGKVIWEGLPHYNPASVERVIAGALK